MSIHDDFTAAGHAYAEQLRATADAAAQAKAQREQATGTAAAWLKNGLDRLDAAHPEQTKNDAANGSDDFNQFFGIK